MGRRGLILILMLSVGCGLAYADTITVTGVDSTRGEYGLWINELGTPKSVYYAGVINILLNQTYSRDSLCAQLFVDIGFGTYYTTVMSPSEAQQAYGRNLEEAAWLVDNELPAVTTSAQGAALQLAIWDIVEDGGDGLASGSVAVSSDLNNPTDPTVLGLANSYEQDALGPDLQGPFQTSDLAFVYVNTDSGGSAAQMLVGPQFQDNGPQPAPEPSTFALGGGGLVAAGFLTYRSRKAVPAS